MYFLAKAFQAAGLTVILIGFIVNFPALMSHTALFIGLLLFALGWVLQRFLIRESRP